MDEVVQQIQQRTGISQEQARTAAETVVSFLKDRLPEPMRGQVDALLGGAGGQGGSNPLGNLGGIGGLGGNS